MLNFEGIYLFRVFIWTQAHGEIFKSALVYLQTFKLLILNIWILTDSNMSILINIVGTLYLIIKNLDFVFMIDQVFRA